MVTVLLTVGIALVALLFGVLVTLVRGERVSPGAVRVLAVVCAVALLVMVVTDWPTDALNRFWADHSVLGAVASTALMVGIGYLFWDWADRTKQDRLAAGLSGAGLGGMVDHLIDAEVALALVSGEEPPQHEGWDGPNRPLRWLREYPAARACDSDTGRPAESDPRSIPVALPETEGDWRVQLVDQAVRRLLAGMRDWTPLVGSSNDGTTALLHLSEIRKDLMELAHHLENDRDSESVQRLIALRHRLRILAWLFEDLARNATHISSTGFDTPLRAEVIQTLWPLPPLGNDFAWSADREALPSFGRTWRERLSGAIDRLSRDAGIPATPRVAKK